MKWASTATARRIPFFYGWVIVAVGFAVNFSEGALRGSMISVFMVPMTTDLGWSRTAISAAISIAAVLTALISPITGPFMDRYGARMIIVGGLLVSSLSLMGLAFVNNLILFYVLFSLSRALGGSALGLGMNVTISNWFIRLRGRAIAINSTGSRVSVPLFILLTEAIIAWYSWRAAWFALGVIIMVVAVPATLLFLRRLPEDMGLRPDGDRAPAVTDVHRGRHGAGRADVSFTRKEAVRTPALWLIIVTTTFGSFAAQSVNIQALASFTDRGIPSGQAALVVSVSVLLAGVFSLAWGFIEERVPVHHAAALVYATGALAMLCIILASTLPFAYGYAVFYGISFGGTRILSQLLYAEYYGRAHLGSIIGFAQPFSMVGQAVGPVVGGLAYDLQGTYTSAFLVFLLAYLVSVPLILMAKPPRKPVAAPQA